MDQMHLPKRPWKILLLIRLLCGFQLQLLHLPDALRVLPEQRFRLRLPSIGRLALLDLVDLLVVDSGVDPVAMDSEVVDQDLVVLVVLALEGPVVVEMDHIEAVDLEDLEAVDLDHLVVEAGDLEDLEAVDLDHLVVGAAVDLDHLVVEVVDWEDLEEVDLDHLVMMEAMDSDHLVVAAMLLIFQSVRLRFAYATIRRCQPL
jgi:hypothetical protein